MTLEEFAWVFGFWIGYPTLVFLCAWGVLKVTKRIAGWRRRAVVSLLLAVFFAPSVVGMGHGGGIGPAWLALFQMFPVRLGVVPILVTFVVFFAVGSVVSWTRGSGKMNE